jgi:3-keto-5-aminohexanoate cleavage enzyme
MSLDDKLLVTVAPSIPPYLAAGLPGLDLSPEGVAAEVIRAAEAGANVVHLHVWDEQGQPTRDLATFERTLNLIREQSDIVIEGSTGGVNTLSAADRSVALRADIELASLNPGSVNYDAGVYVNSPEDIRYWAGEMQRRRIKADMAIFEAGMIANALALAEQGLLSPPLLFSFVLGQTGAMAATPKNLFFLSESIPPGASWAVAGHGGHDLRMSALALGLGGHVRAGFEDNAFYRPGELATSNAQLIERLVRLAREMGREVATTTEARQLLGLRPRPSAEPSAGIAQTRQS